MMPINLLKWKRKLPKIKTKKTKTFPNPRSAIRVERQSPV
jgi:hypothetical protein